MANGKKTEYSVPVLVFAWLAGPLFFALGAGAIEYFGNPRARVRVRYYDLEAALQVAGGVFLFCLVISTITLARILLKRRKSRR